MPPPFNINETSPAPSSLISSFPADEQSNRATIEDWLSYISDPATGMIRSSVLPPSGTAEIETGSKVLFVQTAAPTGWTKDVTHNNKALRIVNGTAGTGGSVAFTTAFTSQTPAGTIAGTVSTGTNSATTDTGTVGSHGLTTAEMPSHSHSFSASTSGAGAHNHSLSHQVLTTDTSTGSNNSGANGSSFSHMFSETTSSVGDHAHSVSGTTGAAGSGNGHNHTLTMNAHTHTITMNSHTHTFTGSALDLTVAYVDVIICTRN